MDTTEAGRPSPFIFLSDNNRSVRKSRHVESGPPEFATAVDKYRKAKGKTWYFESRTYRLWMANRWKVCISETFAEIHFEKLEMLIVLPCVPWTVKEPDNSFRNGRSTSIEQRLAAENLGVGVS